MANVMGFARTNYVKVKDLQGLSNALKDLGIEVLSHISTPNLVAFFPPKNSDDGTFPQVQNPYDENELHDLDWQTLVIPYLEDRQVLVVMTAGYEGSRYCYGDAIAYTKNQPPVWVALTDIYQKAAKAFGVSTDDITLAEY